MLISERRKDQHNSLERGEKVELRERINNNSKKGVELGKRTSNSSKRGIELGERTKNSSKRREERKVLNLEREPIVEGEREERITNNS